MFYNNKSLLSDDSVVLGSGLDTSHEVHISVILRVLRVYIILPSYAHFIHSLELAPPMTSFNNQF
jgi:hypothetical protein